MNCALRPLLSSLALALPVLAPAQEPAAVSEEEFVAWVREAAIPLESLDWRAVDLAPFAALDPLLEGKRIVYLGEPDHYIHEKMDFRMILIRFLHSRGWRHVGMEQGRSDGKRIDRYLETGDESWLERVAIFGYDGYLRDDRDDLVPGWTGGQHPELRQRAVDEALWFARQMRLLNETLESPEERLTYFGFDVSMKPGGSYVDARELLEPHAAEPLAAELLEHLERVPGESRPEEIARLEALVGRIEARATELRALLGADGVRELRRAIVCLKEGLRFVDALLVPRLDTDAKHALLRTREENMHRQMDELLDEVWGPDEKIILLGHDLHLSRESERAEWEGRTMWPTIGTHLAHTRPGEVWAVWMLFERGVHGSPLAADPVQPIRSRRRDVERLLARAGERYLLPLASEDPRAAFLDEPRDLLVGGFRPRCVLCEQADAVFFVREVGAQTGR